MSQIDFSCGKQGLRKAISKISVEDRNGKDCNIFASLAHMEEFVNAKSLFAFMPMGAEPNILPLLELAEEAGKRIAVPVVDSKENSTMHFEEFSSNDAFTSGLLGGYEPEHHRRAEFIPDIILVPMLAFDGDKNRLGRGAGFYDRFLMYGTGAIKIGVSYSDFKLETVLSEGYDVPMDIIVTDREIIR